MIIAREFSELDKEQVFEMIDEIRNFDDNFEGFNSIGRINTFEEFLTKLEINKHQELIKPDYSPQTTFGLFENNKLIGGFTIRHELKGNLINHGGNIGYLIRPSKRAKGYGKQLLKLALEEAKKIGLKKVLVTCRVENVPSEKVIIANGGVYENNFFEEENGETYKRYWIIL